MSESEAAPIHRVSLVLDPQFGPQAVHLSQQMHLWMLDTKANRSAAESVWTQMRRLPLSDPLAGGITLFEASADALSDEALINILDMIGEHHGAWSHSPPLSELIIYGAPDPKQLLRVLDSAGFIVTQQEPGRVVCAVVEEAQ